MQRRAGLTGAASLCWLAPCRAYFCRAFDELSDGSAKDRRQIRTLVTAGRLVSSGTVRRVHPEQAIQLGVDIQDRVLVVVAACQEYPRPAGTLERDDHP
jgi:hypothetical protein